MHHCWQLCDAGLMEANELRTDRLILRSAHDADWLVFEQVWSDPVIRRYLGGPLPPEVQTVRRAAGPRSGDLVVRRRVDTTAVGVCALALYRTDIELSYAFLPEHWGHGYAAEACHAVLEFGFASHPRLGRIIAVTQTANARSHRLLQRLAMTPIDTYTEWDAPQTVYAVSRAAFGATSSRAFAEDAL